MPPHVRCLVGVSGSVVVEFWLYSAKSGPNRALFTAILGFGPFPRQTVCSCVRCVNCEQGRLHGHLVKPSMHVAKPSKM